MGFPGQVTGPQEGASHDPCARTSALGAPAAESPLGVLPRGSWLLGDRLLSHFTGLSIPYLKRVGFPTLEYLQPYRVSLPNPKVQTPKSERFESHVSTPEVSDFGEFWIWERFRF